MTECEIASNLVLEIKEDTNNDTVVSLVELDGSVIARHSMYPIPRENVLELFQEIDNKELKSIDCPMYAGFIESKKQGVGIGTWLWKFGEENFYNTHEKPYLRFVIDMGVDDNWSTRHIQDVIDYLRFKGIPVTTKLEDYTNGKYMGILLFGNV